MLTEYTCALWRAWPHAADRAMPIRSGYAVPAAAVLTKPLPMRNAKTPTFLYNHLIVKKHYDMQLYGRLYNTQNTLRIFKKTFYIKATQ